MKDSLRECDVRCGTSLMYRLGDTSSMCLISQADERKVRAALQQDHTDQLSLQRPVREAW